MRALLAILLFPLLVQAAGEGMWQASSVGVTLNHRGESMSSAPLSTRQPASGLMTLVAWRYQLIGPTPAGLRVRLCSQSRCVELEGQMEPPWPFPVYRRQNRCALSGKCLAVGG